MRYGRGTSGDAVAVQLLRPRALRLPSFRRALGRLRHDPCIRVRHTTVSGGGATLYARLPRCKPRSGDASFALVRLPRALPQTYSYLAGFIHLREYADKPIDGKYRIIQRLGIGGAQRSAIFAS